MASHESKQITTTIKRFWPNTEAAYLFGSYAREEAWPQSDVDIALLLPFESAKQERALAISRGRVALSEVCRREVDLVNLRFVSTVLQNEVIHSGQRIYTGDEDAVLAFEMKVLGAYQKLNEERREIVEEFLRTGRAYPV